MEPHLEKLFQSAKTAMALNHAPYSKFPVGAALLTDKGETFCGANIEIISYPEGWCAETTALSHFVMAGGGTITDICVVAKKKDKITPCGGCRQRLAEFAGPETRLHLCDQDGIVETVTLEAIFPNGFTAEVLGA